MSSREPFESDANPTRIDLEEIRELLLRVRRGTHETDLELFGEVFGRLREFHNVLDKSSEILRPCDPVSLHRSLKPLARRSGSVLPSGLGTLRGESRGTNKPTRLEVSSKDQETEEKDEKKKEKRGRTSRL